MYVGALVDTSHDLREEAGLERAITWASELWPTGLSDRQRLLLDYFTSNAWADLLELRTKGTDKRFDWNQEESERQVFHLRRAYANKAFEGSEQMRQCQILTNLGNSLSHIGRFVEAVEYWDRALAIDPDFGMAVGNRGHGLTYYASALYDDGHQFLLLKQARSALSRALSLALEPGAQPRFEKRLAEIDRSLGTKGLAATVDMDVFSLGRSKAESGYRRWCLQNRLFLNPLNDLGVHSIAATDVLSTPSIVTPLDHGCGYQGFFNQMKQEFVSARYLYYEGISLGRPHYSDKDVLLLDTLDYPEYSVSVEKGKAAFRMAYSLLDKIAWFLVVYLDIKSKLKAGELRRVSFRNIWYKGLSRSGGLWSDLQQCQNWPMRGLFWLSKDLYEERPEFRDSMEPDAKQLADVRNHLEHKYLKLHDCMWIGEAFLDDPTWRACTDDLAFSLYRSDFEAKTLRMLKMARGALIYLSLAIHREEQRRSQARDGKGISVPMFLDAYDDKWKR